MTSKGTKRYILNLERKLNQKDAEMAKLKAQLLREKAKRMDAEDRLTGKS